jgi:hypothetical protein
VFASVMHAVFLSEISVDLDVVVWATWPTFQEWNWNGPSVTLASVIFWY